MKKNDNLNVAKKQKRDEFYTSFDDIQLEVNHYERHFENKTVLCNCDDPFESQFCFFFLLNFNYLKLKRLICTSYSSSPIISEQLLLFDEEEQPLKRGCGYVIDITEPIAMENGEGVSEQDVQRLLKSKKRGVKKLKGDGDFRSEECIEYLKQADIVVTNPPFSLFREYVAQLMEYKKKFLIIGNLNAITYKEVFPLIKDNEMWFGCGFTSGNAYFKMIKDDIREYSSSFYDKSTGLVKFGNVRWFTNLDHNKRHEKLELYMHYYGNEEHYPKYDNFDAINVNKVAEIPLDYFEINGNKALTKEEGEVQLFTEQNRTEQNRTEQNRTEQNRTEPALGLSECQSHSSTNTTQTNLSSPGSTATYRATQNMEGDSQLMEERHMRESSSNAKCNGIMGVPISFLDKYNPEQFIIVGNEYTFNIEGGRGYVNKKRMYSRIFIKHKV